MVSFFGLKIGGDKKKKTQPSATPDSSTKPSRRLDQTKANDFGSPNGASTWDGTPGRKRLSSSARPGTSHSFRSFTTPRPVFMNGTATASLVDLQNFDHIPRPNRDSIRHTPESETRPTFSSPDRFSMKPRAAIGAVGFSSSPSNSRSAARPSTSSGVTSDPMRQPSFSHHLREPLPPIAPRESSLANRPNDTGSHSSRGSPFSTGGQESSPPVAPVTQDSLDSLFSSDDALGLERDDKLEDPPAASFQNAPITINTAVPSVSDTAPIPSTVQSSTTQSAESSALSFMSNSSSRSYVPSYGDGTPTVARPKLTSPGVFKPYSPAVALNTANAATTMRSPSSASLQLTPSLATTFYESPSSQAPTIDTAISASASPVISESPFSQFNFEFDLGPSSSFSSPSKSAVSTPATEAMSIMDRKDSFSRASTASPSPSLTLISSHESGLSSRPSVSNSTSMRSTPSPSQSVRSARSIERPSFEKSVSTKPVAPSGLRVVRNAIPSIVPDTSGLGIAADRSSFVAKLQRTNFGARSPTPEAEFVLHGDEALALQWEGPPIIRDVAAKRDTLTICSPRRQSFSFNLENNNASQASSTTDSKHQESPERPKTSAGPTTTFSRSLTQSPVQRTRRASGGFSSNARLDAIRPAPLKIGSATAKTVQAMPKSPLCVAPQQATLQANAVSAQAAEVAMISGTETEIPTVTQSETTVTDTMETLAPATSNIAGDQLSAISPATEYSFFAESSTVSPPLDSPASVGTVNSSAWPTRFAYDSVKDKNGYAVPTPRGMTVIKSPMYQTSALPFNQSFHESTSPLPPARHPGRGNANTDVPRASNVNDYGHSQRPKLQMPQDKFMSPRPAVQPPVSAVTQSAQVVWPLAAGELGAKPCLGALEETRSEAPTHRQGTAQASVRDRVRNLEVQDKAKDRSRSPQPGFLPSVSKSPIPGVGMRRDPSLLRNRPPPRPKREDSASVPVAMTGDGFI
ncbi:hypothetical protein BROUX41_000970 [Berkeleyomyces rouxiae]